MHAASCADRGSRRRALALGCFFLLVISVVQGFYAVQLNQLYYSHLGPIFDSASYLNIAAEVMTISREEGLLAGLRAAANPATVMLPFVAAAFAGQVFEPSRALGVWLGEIWLAALGMFVYGYALIYRRLHPIVALAFAGPFVSFATVYWHSGGLSDFRMDLQTS